MHQYNRVTGDLGFMLDQGAEVLVETARLWIELGFHSERRDGRFCINAVTGPDEYTTVVDNNAYTNLMAKENLEIAVRVIEWLQGADPAAHAELARATGLTDREVDGLAAGGGDDARPAQRRARDRAAGRALPRAQALGLRGHARGQAPAPAALPPARALPPPGDQADRRRARHLSRRPPFQRRTRSGARSTTTTRSRPATRRCRPASRA